VQENEYGDKNKFLVRKRLAIKQVWHKVIPLKVSIMMRGLCKIILQSHLHHFKKTFSFLKLD
jgi:hypothetical protein